VLESAVDGVTRGATPDPVGEPRAASVACSISLSFERQQEDQMVGSRTCSNCGIEGHDRRSCPVPQSAGECSVCHYRGHDKRNCPRK